MPAGGTELAPPDFETVARKLHRLGIDTGMQATQHDMLVWVADTGRGRQHRQSPDFFADHPLHSPTEPNHRHCDHEHHAGNDHKQFPLRRHHAS